MEDLEMICCEIISYSGGARSCFVEAMGEAKKNDFEKAKNLIKEGEEMYSQGHKVHADLLQQVALGDIKEVTLLLAHAEDQLMSAEVIRIMAEEIVSLNEKLNSIK